MNVVRLNSSSDHSSLHTPGVLMLWLMRVFALLALGISGYLAQAALLSDGAVGCGSEGVLDCSQVLQSRWSRWLEVPVSVPGVAIYGSMVVLSAFVGSKTPSQIRQTAWTFFSILSLLAAGAALWFLGLQIFVLGEFCIYCFTIHFCALVIFSIVIFQGDLLLNHRRMSYGISFLGLAILIGGQIFAKEQINYEKEIVTNTEDKVYLIDKKEEVQEETVSPETPSTTSSESRLISILDGKAKIDAFKQPILGSPHAKHVLVKLFDYTCPHCRTMHRQLEAAHARYGNQLAILLLPVPLNKGCNGRVRSTPQKHEHACVLAKHALAVFRSNREKFHEFNAWLFDPPNGRRREESRQEAERLIGKESLEKELEHWAIDQQISLNVRLYGLCGGGKIPKLLFSQIVIRGNLDSNEELFEQLEKELKIFPRSSAKEDSLLEEREN